VDLFAERDQLMKRVEELEGEKKSFDQAAFERAYAKHGHPGPVEDPA